METKNLKKNNLKVFFSCLVIAFLLSGCLPGWTTYHRPKIFISSSLRPYKEARFALFPFDPGQYQIETGLKIARAFFRELTKRKIVKEVCFLEGSEWYKAGDYDAIKWDYALREASERGFDLIGLGKVEKYIVGKATPTQIEVTFRIMEVSSGNILWWAKDNIKGRPGYRFLFWDIKISPSSPDISKLISKIAKKMVGTL